MSEDSLIKLREKKHQAEEEISKILSDFQEQNGVVIDYVSISSNISICSVKYYRVDIKIEI